MPLEEGQQQEGAAPDVTGAGATFDLPPDPPPAEGGEEGGAGGEPGGQAPKPSRQQRQAERRESFAARAAAAEARAAAAEAANQETARRLAELQGRFNERSEQQRATAPDPDEAKLVEAQRKISAAVARMGAGDATAEADWHAAMREHARIVARQVAREEGAEVEKRVVGKIPAAVDPRVAAFQAEFPHVVGNEAAMAIAKGYAAQLAALEKRDMSNPEIAYATHREAAAHAAKVLGLGQAGSRQRPTNVERDRLSGTGGADSGAGNETVRVHLADEQKALAEQMFRSLPKEQAWSMWWKEIGSKIQK